jgi:hypothetical protein
MTGDRSDVGGSKSLGIPTEMIYWELNVVLTSVILAFVLSASFQRHFLASSTPLSTKPMLLLVVSYGLIIWSQINYLRSVESTPYRTPWRFFPDILILLLYGYWTWNIADYGAVEVSIFFVFGAFLLWDMLKLSEWWEEYGYRDLYRPVLTAGLLTLSGVALLDPFDVLIILGAWTGPLTQLLLLSLFWILKSNPAGMVIERALGLA